MSLSSKDVKDELVRGCYNDDVVPNQRTNQVRIQDEQNPSHQMVKRRSVVMKVSSSNLVIIYACTIDPPCDLVIWSPDVTADDSHVSHLE
jgi:hypothetical protein